MRLPLMKNSLVDLNLRVSDLMLPQSHLWNMEVLEQLFYPQDIKIIDITQISLKVNYSLK